MTAMIKYSAIAMGIQLVLTAIIVMAAHSSGLLLLIDFYYPVIFSIIKAGRFTGESTMMFPVFFGVPIGIIIYSLTFGAVVGYLSRKT